MGERAVETSGLTVYYGRHRGIEDVDLVVERGEVFGFLGPNGAGKTTTLRVLLDVIHPTRGRAEVFGLDCQREGVTVRERVGYLPGELRLFPGLTGGRVLDLLAGMRHEAVDPAYRERLCERLALDPGRRIGEYSHGNRQKVGVVAAFMGRPDLLVLDEPTSGLDPLMQRTVLELVREARDDGRTVLLSSHMLPEVQAVCGRVGIIRRGRLVATERVDVLTRRRFTRLRLALLHDPPADAFDLHGVTEIRRAGTTVELEVREGLDEVMGIASGLGVEDIETLPVTLEEIFLEFYDE